MDGRIVIPARDDIRNIFPDYAVLSDGTASVPHDPATTVVLRNMGLAVPSAILCHYDFPRPMGFQPTEAQYGTVELLTENMRCYALNELGTGKTACVLWAFDYLKRCKLVNRMLVVAPLSSLRRTWLRQIFEFFGTRLRATVLHGTRKQRLAQLARDDVDIYIINHDGVNTIWDELAQRSEIDLLALDELAAYRNRGKGKHSRTKRMQELQRRFRWVWGITGAPMPQAPTDVYHQCKVVTPWTVPKFWTFFREDLMYKVSPFKWLPKRDGIAKAFRVMQPAVRYTLDDVPEFASQRVDIPMGKRQTEIYESMRKHAVAFCSRGEVVNAVNGGALLSKLLQISLGYVYTDKHTVVTLDNDDRLAAMIEMVNASAGKVIIFTAFKHSLAGIARALVDADIDTSLPVSGDMALRKREEIFTHFQDTDRYRVLPAHPGCMSHSLTLTAADTILWFGPVTSLELYDQANGRIRRLGQTRRQLFAHFQSTAAERRLYDALTSKQISQFNFLELFRD